MKIKSLLFVCCLSLFSSVFAADRHMHPKADTNPTAAAIGGCEINILNDSYDNVNVYGTFDDGTSMTPFSIYRFGSASISLYYYNYCHRDMYLDIVTFTGYHVYSGYTNVDSIVRVVPYLTNQVKAEVQAK